MLLHPIIKSQFSLYLNYQQCFIWLILPSLIHYLHYHWLLKLLLLFLISLSFHCLLLVFFLSQFSLLVLHQPPDLWSVECFRPYPESSQNQSLTLNIIITLTILISPALHNLYIHMLNLLFNILILMSNRYFSHDMPNINSLSSPSTWFYPFSLSL